MRSLKINTASSRGPFAVTSRHAMSRGPSPVIPRSLCRNTPLSHSVARSLYGNFTSRSRSVARHLNTPRHTASRCQVTVTPRNAGVKATVVIYSLAKVQGQRPVGFEDKVETNGRTDGRTDGRTEALMRLVKLFRYVSQTTRDRHIVPMKG